MADTSPQRGTGGGRPKSPTRLVTVADVERITPRTTRIAFTGDALTGFGPPRPGAHMKLIFVPDGSNWSPDDEAAPRPPRRTYTPRRFDPVANRLEIEFVHHGDGIAALWAARARPGDTLYINGPGGGYDLPPDTNDVVLVADETAMPAAGTILDALPATVRPIVLCEIADAADKRPLSASRDVSPVWLPIGDSGHGPGFDLERAIRDLSGVGPATSWWIACEAAAMRRIRRHLLAERKVDPARVHTRGYWKLGETAYPDHDYGKE